MKRPPLSVGWPVVVLLIVPSLAAARDDALDVKKVLEEMAKKQGQFDPTALHLHGAKGLSRLLDELFPDTAEDEASQAKKKEIQALIRRLGDEKATVREAALTKLIRIARPHRALIEKATRDPDADVRLRAFLILRTWQPPQVDTLEPYAAAFNTYVNGITERERVGLLARRLVKVLEPGMPTGGRLRLTQTALRVVLLDRDDGDAVVFRPLLKHKDVAVPVFLLQTLGSSGSSTTAFSQLVLDGLASDRKEVIVAALNFAPRVYPEDKKAPQVRRCLRRLFEGEDDDLKFRASFTLMHDFDDRAAFRYLLTQTKSKNQDRVQTAIYWVGDSCHWKKPITAEVLDALTPFLSSSDDRLRRAASTALATYHGEAVVKALIPMLGDRLPIIVEGTGNRLLEQDDKAMLKRLLRQATEKHDSKTVRARAKVVLGKVTEK